MPMHRDMAICLRRVEFSETSQVLTLLTREHGIVKLLAKGAHRRTKAGSSKFDGGVDLLELGNAVFTLDPRKDLSLLTEWKLLDGYRAVRRDLRSIYLGMYAAELMMLLLEEQDPQPTLFRLLDSLLTRLHRSAEQWFVYYQVQLFREAGELPDLLHCVECATPIADESPTFYSPARGGAICRNCESLTPDRIRIDVRILRMLRPFHELNLEQTSRLPILTRRQSDPINSIFANHLRFTTGRTMRLWKYVLPPRSLRVTAPVPVAPAAG